MYQYNCVEKITENSSGTIFNILDPTMTEGSCFKIVCALAERYKLTSKRLLLLLLLLLFAIIL